MADTDAFPAPKKNAIFRVYFVLFDPSGTRLTSATGLDSERSLDGAAFADCTNEAIHVGNGTFYLELTAAEMNTSNTAVQIKNSSGEVLIDIILSPSANTNDALSDRIPEELSSGRMEVDVQAIDDDTGAAARLALSMTALVQATVDTGGGFTPTKTQFQSSILTEPTTDHYVNRTILWVDGVLKNQVTQITGYTYDGSRATVTVSAMTDAPTNGETFLII